MSVILTPQVFPITIDFAPGMIGAPKAILHADGRIEGNADEMAVALSKATVQPGEVPAMVNILMWLVVHAARKP